MRLLIRAVATRSRRRIRKRWSSGGVSGQLTDADFEKAKRTLLGY